MVFLSRNNLPETKDGEHVTNLREYMSIETHLIALNINGDSVAYFKSFGDEHIPEEVEKIIGKKISKQILIEYKQMIE